MFFFLFVSLSYVDVLFFRYSIASVSAGRSHSAVIDGKCQS